jgi:hypothetical protein
LKSAPHLAAWDKPEPLKAQAIDHLACDNAEGLGLKNGNVADLREGGCDLGQMGGSEFHMVCETCVLQQLLAASQTAVLAAPPAGEILSGGKLHPAGCEQRAIMATGAKWALASLGGVVDQQR